MRLGQSVKSGITAMSQDVYRGKLNIWAAMAIREIMSEVHRGIRRLNNGKCIQLSKLW
tara:strand:- start:731 stop:904 length:174 start_codon:yes stop_codon:yes gene_type:complete